MWADAMAWVLCTFRFTFDFVVVSLPTFGQDNFTPFRDAFAAVHQRAAKTGWQLHTAVLVTRRHSMLSLAVTVCNKLGRRAGILNPSDVIAMRTGWMGMYWDDGHVALEELLAVQTTLLLHHRDVNADLYRDPIHVHYIMQPDGTG